MSPSCDKGSSKDNHVICSSRSLLEDDIMNL